MRAAYEHLGEEKLIKAKKQESTEREGGAVLGVDPARENDDRENSLAVVERDVERSRNYVI